jgi:type II secretory pathway component HofQ
MCARRVAVFAITFGLAAGAPATADHSESRPRAFQETTAEKTRNALQQTVSLDLPYQPLSEVVRLLRDQSGVNLVLDRQGLGTISLNPDETFVTAPLRMKLGMGLRQILSQHSLDYAIIDDMVLITTEELAIQRQTRQRVSVDADHVQLGTALDRLARLTGTNLVLDPQAASKANMAVSLRLQDVPLEAAVKLLAEQVGLKPVQLGNVLVVTTKANAAELAEDSESRRPTAPAVVDREAMIDFTGR